jgi:hypothetical protein
MTHATSTPLNTEPPAWRAESTPPEPAAPPPPRPRARRRGRLIAIIAAVVVLLGAGGLFASTLPGGGDERPASPTKSLERLELDLRPRTPASTPTVQSDMVLEKGAEYVITVRGTGANVEAHGPDLGGGCGTREPKPETPSPGTANGPANIDAEGVFWSLSANGCGPEDDFQLDVGSGEFDPPPIGVGSSGLSPDHEYRYKVRGEGEPLEAKFYSSVDAYGVFTIEIRGG